MERPTESAESTNASLAGIASENNQKWIDQLAETKNSKPSNLDQGSSNASIAESDSHIYRSPFALNHPNSDNSANLQVGVFKGDFIEFQATTNGGKPLANDSQEYTPLSKLDDAFKHALKDLEREPKPPVKPADQAGQEDALTEKAAAEIKTNGTQLAEKEDWGDLPDSFTQPLWSLLAQVKSDVNKSPRRSVSDVADTMAGQLNTQLEKMGWHATTGMFDTDKGYNFSLIIAPKGASHLDGFILSFSDKPPEIAARGNRAANCDKSLGNDINKDCRDSKIQ